MAHTAQERYSKLVLAKLRATTIYAPIFNRRYEGDPKAGAVKIPVRDGEVVAGAYDKANGKALTIGTTTYMNLPIDQDKAVNELIDGYDAASVPDNLVADRLDSAGYSLAISVDGDLRSELITNGTTLADTTAITKANAYEKILDAVSAAKRLHVKKSEMWLSVSSDVYNALLKDTDHFVRSTALGDTVVLNGEVGRVDGVPVIEDVDLDATVDFILGNRVFAHYVDEWGVPVHVADLADGVHIGASAVQGRRVYGKKISRPTTILVKKHTA